MYVFFSSKRIKGILFIALSVLIDHSTKYLMQHWLQYRDNYVVTDFFSLIRRWNMGIGWGLFPASSWYGKLFLSLVAVIFVGILWKWYEKSHTASQQNGLILIMGGGLSNAIDRILHGGVFDFIDLHYGPHHFHTFNIADILISVGFIFLLADLWIWKKNTPLYKK